MATRQYSRLMPLGWKKLGLISGDYSDKDAEVPPFHSHACSGLVIVGPVRPGLGAPGVPLHHSPCLGHDRIPGRSWLPLRMTGRSRRGPAESAAFWVSWPSHRDCPILSWPTPLSVPSAPVRPFLLVVCPSPLAPAQNASRSLRGSCGTHVPIPICDHGTKSGDGPCWDTTHPGVSGFLSAVAGESETSRLRLGSMGACGSVCGRAHGCPDDPQPVSHLTPIACPLGTTARGPPASCVHVSAGRHHGRDAGGKGLPGAGKRGGFQGFHPPVILQWG